MKIAVDWLVMKVMTKTMAIVISLEDYNNETPTVRGLAADNNNKLYTETMIFL